MRHPAFLVSAAALAALVSGAAVAQAVGVDAMVKNAVQVTPAGGVARAALVRDPVSMGDAFATGPASAVQVLLRDHSVFTVGANARISIDRFVYDPERNSSDVAASVTRGAFRFMSGHSLSGQGQRAITTPVATIGVRGTIVDGVVGAQIGDVLAGEPGLPAASGDLSNATLVVLRGPGSTSEGIDKPGSIVVTPRGGSPIPLNSPGLAVIIYEGAPPFGPFPLSGRGSQALFGMLIAPGQPGRPGAGFAGSVGAGSGQANHPTPPGTFSTAPGGQPPISNLGGGQRAIIPVKCIPQQQQQNCVP